MEGNSVSAGKGTIPRTTVRGEFSLKLKRALYRPVIEGTIKILGDVSSSLVISEVLKVRGPGRALWVCPAGCPGGIAAGPQPCPPWEPEDQPGLCRPLGWVRTEAAALEPHHTPLWASPPRAPLVGAGHRRPPETGRGHLWRRGPRR